LLEDDTSLKFRRDAVVPRDLHCSIDNPESIRMVNTLFSAGSNPRIRAKFRVVILQRVLQGIMENQSWAEQEYAKGLPARSLA
jgi:hypothetical protein